MAAPVESGNPLPPLGASVASALDGITVVDVHGHIGISHSTGVRLQQATLLAAMDAYGISATMVMPQPTDPTALQLHDEIAEMTRTLPGQIFGIALLDPRMPDRDYDKHAERLLVDEGFVALKLHTFGHSVSPDDDVCDKVFRAARRHKRPVMVHTGLGGPHTLPDAVRAAAARYDDIPIVLCHAGFGAFWEQAIQVADDHPNVLLEPSWSPGFAIGLMADRVGADRVMFGSDHVSNIPVELVKVALLTISPSERAAILGVNAIRVFGLDLHLEEPVSS
jgi:predicted TIM-barrel fold metal-dependent hydrolase